MKMEQWDWTCLRAAFWLWNTWHSSYWSLSSQWFQFAHLHVRRGFVHQRLNHQSLIAVTKHLFELEKLFCWEFKADWWFSSSASSCPTISSLSLPAFASKPLRSWIFEFQSEFGVEWGKCQKLLVCKSCSQLGWRVLVFLLSHLRG